MNELELLKLVIEKLNILGIEYMISGSIAMNFYAEPRMTRDIDIIINIGMDDIDKLFNIFHQDFYIDSQMIKDAINSKSMFNIIHLESVIKIDFIIRKDSEYRLLEFKNRQNKIMDGAKINIVAIEDLILSKLYWTKDSYSEQQIKDIRNLLRQEHDDVYIKRWIDKLNLTAIYQKVVENE